MLQPKFAICPKNAVADVVRVNPILSDNADKMRA
jgi:hypothetical protein